MTRAADAEFAQWVQTELDVIEERLAQAAEGQTEFVTEVARHITTAGGKRFRPLLVTLAAGVGRDLGIQVASEALTRAALVVELTHVASLYHDDVMDSADVRRNSPSANARWDNSVAIMVGDFLFSRASSIVATLGVDYVVLQADTFARLVHGQIAELMGPGADDPIRHYLDVVTDKTGSLIATSTRFGGMVAGLPDEMLDALSRYGEEIGIVFQLSDDLIDITSEDTGKTPGTDLREGVKTLATLTVLASSDPQDADLRAKVSRPLLDDEVPEVLGQLRSHPAIAAAKAEVRRRAEAARSYLAPLPDGPARRALEELCDTVVSRSS